MPSRRLLALAALPLLLAACETATTAPAAGARPIVVFFAQDSASVDENGAAIVASAAEAAKARP
ncbi:MAG: OmpA family protein, partial [Acetobacteraceae bacterium]|nr:OmpA family protein [Acetobacteraceae bacterium]